MSTLASFLALSLWRVHANEAALHDSVQNALQMAKYIGLDLSFDRSEYINNTWSDIENTSNTESILDGICNITALHNLGQQVGVAEKCTTDLLLNKACSLLYNTAQPDVSRCKRDIGVYCFLIMIVDGRMNSLYSSFADTMF